MNSDKPSKKWRTISGCVGFSLFLLIHLTDIFAGLTVLAGLLQVAANIFVFICWIKAYPQCHGFERFVTCVGVVFPPVMANITFLRVIVPVIF